MTYLPEGTNVFDHIWNLYTEPVKEKIRLRAKEIAEGDKREDIVAADAFDAIRAFLPGHLVDKSSLAEPKEGSWFNKNVTGFIGITATLAVVFGILGLVPAFIQNVNPEYIKSTSGFIEISKIFAGALVGGAAGAVVTTAARRDK